MSCCICLDPISDLVSAGLGEDKIFEGACGHPLHLKCVVGLVESKCPMCRAPLAFPQKINRKIRDNRKQHQREDEENDRLDIIASSNILINQFPPIIQKDLADLYLISLGIYSRTKSIGTQTSIFSEVVVRSVEKQRKRLFRRDLKSLCSKVTKK